MRPTTLISFLVTSLALLSQSPAAYAAPIPSQLNSGGAKRGCSLALCRVEEPTPSTTASNTTPTSTTDTTSKTPTVLSLVDALINTLNSYRSQYTTTSDPTTFTDFAIPADPPAEPTDDATTDGSPVVAAVRNIELAGE